MKKRLMPNEELVIERINLVKYYNENIQPLGKIFNPMSDNNQTAICPFHKDTDPSLRVWYKKNVKMGEANIMYHCFGCNYSGTIISTHQKLQFQYFKRSIDKKQAIIELAQMYGIELLANGFNEDFANIYEEALFKLSDKRSIMLTNPEESITNFEKQNRSILSDKHMTFEQKLRDLAELDLVYSVINYHTS